MEKIKLGILRENKIPPEKRVPFTPEQAALILKDYPNVEIYIQPYVSRCFSDREYEKAGVLVKNDISDCNILMGIKEVAVKNLIPKKKYIFFSHTIKKQPQNKALLKEVLLKKIHLVDYEALVDAEGNRIIGFGRFAGMVGAYNALLAYGEKYKLYALKPAHLCKDKNEMLMQMKNASLPNIKIAVTGGGRVANGACETLGAKNVRRVTPYEFINYTFREAVYAQLRSQDYYISKDNAPFSGYEFHHAPENFKSHFADSGSFASACDILVHCTYWDPRADVLFTLQQMSDPDFRINVIADVSCDLNGSIPSTVMHTTIENKFYGYDPVAGKIVDAFDKNAVTVMAIDNLPCELPRDSSEGFGKHFIERVLSSLLTGDEEGIIERGTIAKDGMLTGRFSYLNDYVA